MEERWDHRADLAEQAVEERHRSRLWGIPRTNLAVVSWPPATRDKLFYHWHYDWQAQYIDCQADAAERRSRKSRLSLIRRTVRGIRIRNLGPLTKHRDYDDKAWLALALHRVNDLERYGKVRYLPGLEQNLFGAVDELTGVLPWTEGDTYYNVPTNGPAAVLAARSGRPELAAQIVDWIFARLVNADGLVTDGLRMTLAGPERVDEIRAANQGIVLGALIEIARARRTVAGVDSTTVSEEGMDAITRVHHLVESISRHMTTPGGVIDWHADGGDHGLSKGILARYLALVATGLPSDDRLSRSARRLARRMVLRSAESVWHHRLEMDGLPVFPAGWAQDAVLPQAGSALGVVLAGHPGAADIPERDLSVQLSGWMLMEAAAKVSILPGGSSDTADGSGSA
jgi:predicted alpha-1,6-mannanase (GH76 family)